MVHNYNTENLVVIEHPLCEHNMSLLRNKDINSDMFKNTVHRLATMLIYEAAKSLPLESCLVETPLAVCEAKKLKEKTQVIFVPILRAGLVLSDTASEIIPNASILHVGMYRDEETCKPVWYYDKTPAEFENPDDVRIFILDPMLATGNTAKEAIALFVKKGINIVNITFISILSAPEGLAALTKEFPGLQIITCKVDEKLNSRGYILPGLGDVGDRFFNTFG